MGNIEGGNSLKEGCCQGFFSLSFGGVGLEYHNTGPRVMVEYIYIYKYPPSWEQSARPTNMSCGATCMVGLGPLVSLMGPGPKRPDKHEDPTQQYFWYPPCIGPWNQSVRSLCLCGLLGYCWMLSHFVQMVVRLRDLRSFRLSRLRARQGKAAQATSGLLLRNLLKYHSY